MIYALLTGWILTSTANAGLIEIGGRIAFSDAEERMVELANRGLRAELEALPWQIRIERQRENERGSRTDFGGKRISIVITGDVQDPFDFAGTICHELGHILSHSPLVTAEGRAMREFVPGYTDVEGECDYFAGAKCIPLFQAALPAVAPRAECTGAPDVARCSLVAEAGLHTVQAMIHKDRSHTRGPVDFTTPTWDMDPAVTYSGYGDYACRLRTFFAGGWCGSGECTKFPGARPRCWYVPGTEPSVNRYGN